MFRRRFAGAALISLVASVAAGALWASVGRRVTPRGPPPPSTDVVQAALARPGPGVDFTGARAEGLVWFLRDHIGLGFAIDWEALAAAGIERQTPIDLVDHGGCLGETLTVFAEAHGLTIATRGNRLVLTTRASLDASAIEHVPDWVPAGTPLEPQRREFVRGTHRWTFTVYRDTVSVWRTPADP